MLIGVKPTPGASLGTTNSAGASVPVSAPIRATTNTAAAASSPEM